jgi:predicted esterase
MFAVMKFIAVQIILVLVVLAPSRNVFATDCFSHSTPKYRMIYLHGMDEPGRSPQEKHIRKVLKEFSEENAVEVALPRAKMKCPNHESQICWMWDKEDRKAVIKKKNKIISDSKKCFSSNAPLVWLGFSNGGNLATQIFQSCEIKERIITFGVSGGYLKSWRKRLSQCGRYFAAMGKEDKWNRSHGLKFYRRLKELGAAIEVKEFAGSHEVKLPILKQGLQFVFPEKK